MSDHDPCWLSTTELYVFMFTNMFEYMLEPVVPDPLNHQDLLDRMVTNNAFVARMNQLNLELGPIAA